MKLTELKLPLPLEEIRAILSAHGVKHASVFGSYARNRFKSNSDLDILVQYEDGVSLFDHFDLKYELEKKTGKKVDVVSSRAVSRHLKQYIDKEKIKIL